jgi:hypothetical protein
VQQAGLPEPAEGVKAIQGSKFKVQSSRFKVQGSKFKVQGSRFKDGGVAARSISGEPITPLNLEL